MQLPTLALLIAVATVGAGCASKETKPESAPAAAATPAPAAAPVASKPECPPEPATKKTTAKSKTTKKTTATKTAAKTEPEAVDCEPAKPKTAATATKAAEPAPTKEAEKPTEAGKPRIVKSRDGTFEGEVYGNIPPGSKWAKLQIGMEQPEVERILGGTSNDVRTMPTGKAFIPFYYGTDRYRYEVVYRGQGSVSYTGGSWGGGRGVLMMINYDPKM